MTPNDCMIFIRTLLDDSRDWFPTTTEIENAVNQAQIEKIRQYYVANDERALRPLYRETALLSSGDRVVDINGADLFYPRSCKVYVDNQMPDTSAYAAQFKDPSLFFNYVPPLWEVGMEFPRTAYYTITKAWDGVASDWATYLHFNGSATTLAKLRYIAYPATFQYYAVATQTGLSLPSEYHPEICALAAEILNDMDVGEQERGEPVFQNQRLSMRSIGEVGG